MAERRRATRRAAARRGGGRAASQRQLRVGEALRHALAAVLARDEWRDPALRDRSVTVSEVRVSPDLRRATAYVCRLGGGDTAPLLDGLERAAPRLNVRVAAELRLRNAPRLDFVADPSFDRAARISALLADDAPPRDG